MMFQSEKLQLIESMRATSEYYYKTVEILSEEEKLNFARSVYKRDENEAIWNCNITIWKIYEIYLKDLKHSIFLNEQKESHPAFNKNGTSELKVEWQLNCQFYLIKYI